MQIRDPGDPTEDCNCRCVALTRARWELDASELQTLKDRANFFGLDKTDNFKDFEKKYLKAAETVEKAGKSGIIKSGITGHAADRMSERNVSDADIDDTRKNPLHVKPVVMDALGRKSQVIIGRAATICVNPDTGQIITTWKTGTKIRKKYGGGDLYVF